MTLSDFGSVWTHSSPSRTRSHCSALRNSACMTALASSVHRMAAISCERPIAPAERSLTWSRDRPWASRNASMCSPFQGSLGKRQASSL